MIVIHVNPAKVEKVELVSDSEAEHNLSLAAWKGIAPYVEEMDRVLRQAVDMVLARMKLGRTLLAGSRMARQNGTASHLALQ